MNNETAYIQINRFKLPIVVVKGDVNKAYQKQLHEKWEIIQALRSLDINDFIKSKIERAVKEEKFEEFRITLFEGRKQTQGIWLEGRRDEVLFLKTSIAVYKGLPDYKHVLEQFKKQLRIIEKTPVQMELFN